MVYALGMVLCLSNTGILSFPPTINQPWHRNAMTLSLLVPVQTKNSMSTALITWLQPPFSNRKSTDQLTIYIGDPQSVAAILPSWRNRANPKSAIFRTIFDGCGRVLPQSWANRIFCGFRSRWTIPLLKSAFIAPATNETIERINAQLNQRYPVDEAEQFWYRLRVELIAYRVDAGIIVSYLRWASLLHSSNPLDRHHCNTIKAKQT